MAALANYDAEKKERQRAKENWPLWKKVLAWVWFCRILFLLRVCYYVIEILVLHIIGRRPLYDIDKLIYVCIFLLHCGCVASAAISQDEFHHGRAEPVSGQFSVYDCEDPRTRYTKVDLTTTQPCPDPQTDYAPVYTATVMVLQTDAKSLVDVYTCQAFFSKTVTRCGSATHNYNYGSTRIAVDERLIITPEMCREWTNTSTFVVPTHVLGGRQQTFHLNEGLWTHFDYISHGKHDTDGNCGWADWEYDGVEYTNSYETTSIRARLRKVTGILNQETGSLMAANLALNFKDESTTDGVEGTLVWETSRRNCTDDISLLYEGPVDIHRLNPDIRRAKADEWAGTIIVMENREVKQTGAFIVKPQASSCLPQCRHTHIPGLLVCPDPHRVKDHFVYRPGDDGDIKVVMAAVTHTRIAGSFESGRKFGKIQQQLCDLSLEGKLHQLSDVAGNANEYALRRLHIPGVAPRGRKYLPGGAAGYVASCPEKNATLFAFPNCTMELPIVIQGRPMQVDKEDGHEGVKHDVLFADPITRVVQRLPTIVPCSRTLPIRWVIQGIWYCSSPQVTRCDAPTRLGTDMDMTGLSPEAIDFDPLEGILYSPEQQKENKAYENSLSYRQPILQTIVNNMGKGTSVDGSGHISYGMPFDANQVDELAWQVTGRAFFFVAWFGRYYTVIVGILFLVAVAKLFFGICLRFYMLYTKRGCGIWLLCSLWHTAYLLFGMPWKVARGVYDMAMEEVDKAAAEGLEPCSYDKLNAAVKSLAAGLEKQQELTYDRHERVESFLRHLAANAKDRNVSNYAQDLLDAADDQETNQASTSENKGQDTAP